MSTAAKNLIADIHAMLDKRRALKTFITEMGYSFSARHVLVKLNKADGSGNDHFVVHELKDADDPARIVPFSFLYDRAENNGLVLPHPFSRYEDLVKEAPRKAKN